MRERPSKKEYYLDLALNVSKRGTCLRRNFGAVIVNRDEIVSTGYSGAPRGAKNCIDIGSCPRQKANIPAGERYELCRSVHAEANAIISAERQKMIGGVMYLAGEKASDGSLAEAEPCKMCKRFIINAGIKKVVALQPNGPRVFSVKK
jgi:dCMP deaminase